MGKSNICHTFILTCYAYGVIWGEIWLIFSAKKVTWFKKKIVTGNHTLLNENKSTKDKVDNQKKDLRSKCSL